MCASTFCNVHTSWIYNICDTLRDLILFVQFKNVKNTHGEVLILVKLQASAYNFKINTRPWVFFTFFKLYKCYQIAQCTTYKKLRSNLKFSSVLFSVTIRAPSDLLGIKKQVILIEVSYCEMKEKSSKRNFTSLRTIYIKSE